MVKELASQKMKSRKWVQIQAEGIWSLIFRKKWIHLFSQRSDHRSPTDADTKYAFTQPVCHKQDAAQGNFQAEYNWFEFRVFLLLDQLPYKGKELSLPYYLLIAKNSCQRVLVLCEMQIALYRIWTWQPGPFPMMITITQWPPRKIPRNWVQPVTCYLNHRWAPVQNCEIKAHLPCKKNHNCRNE